MSAIKPLIRIKSLAYARRKIGQILIDDPHLGSGKTVKLTVLGLDQNESKRWQKLARIEGRPLRKCGQVKWEEVISQGGNQFPPYMG